ncbi:MAG TPA: PilZ domain-containing protein [Verrucomicrobiae bacterium]|nr:PilZ domain-containing protein [Verrucomicrobiae bacterium]
MTDHQFRRSGRISKQVPILLIGSDSDGRVFSEVTKTVVISFHGAGIVSANKLIAEQELHIRSMVTNRETAARVVGEIAENEGVYTYGVAFLDESVDFWEVEFPPPPQPGERPLVLALECSSCRATISVQNGDFEFDVCAIHGGLVRYCDNCGMATVWKQTRHLPSLRPFVTAFSPAAKPQPANASVALLDPLPARSDPRPLPAPRPVVPPAPAPLLERRLRVRAKVNYFACVRSEAFGDDIVVCIDMSRGGMSFKTKNFYLVNITVTIAVPFSPESPKAPAIFVPARIASVSDFPNGKLYRCGVEFLITTQSPSQS